MSRSEDRPRAGAGSRADGASYARSSRVGRYVAPLVVLVVILAAINFALAKRDGSTGVRPGQAIPPFALPTAAGSVSGDANVATRPNQGAAGKTPACAVRMAGILNICQLYERGPVVLALFIDEGSCPQVLDAMQALAGEYPGVSFAAVAIKGQRAALRALIARRQLTRVQVGFDRDGVLAGLYKVVSCPQVTFVLPRGAALGAPLLSTPTTAQLHARVSALVRASTGRGWKRPTR
jgi:hypothetical protein